jgi:hypothetical protein
VSGNSSKRADYPFFPFHLEKASVTFMVTDLQTQQIHNCDSEVEALCYIAMGLSGQLETLREYYQHVPALDTPLFIITGLTNEAFTRLNKDLRKAFEEKPIGLLAFRGDEAENIQVEVYRNGKGEPSSLAEYCGYVLESLANGKLE